MVAVIVWLPIPNTGAGQLRTICFRFPHNEYGAKRSLRKLGLLLYPILTADIGPPVVKTINPKFGVVLVGTSTTSPLYKCCTTLDVFPSNKVNRTTSAVLLLPTDDDAISWDVTIGTVCINKDDENILLH
jgi:hypothetical protein